MVASAVWQRLGDVPNYVEPFFGSGAVLLARSDRHQWWDRVETVNDIDGMVSNFWRAVSADPDAVASWADWPINENDLTARHAWLVSRKESLQEKLEGNPDYYDAKIAGWWVWGIGLWIGSEWCRGNGPWHIVGDRLIKTGNGESQSEGVGVARQIPRLGSWEAGIFQNRPDLGHPRGIFRGRPQLTARQDIHKKPSVSFSETSADFCQMWRENLQEMMRQLANRMRKVRICCGDWARVCTNVPTLYNGLTAVFLDPPYSRELRDSYLYAFETDVSLQVRYWAIEHGDNPLFRIALCGY